MTLRTLNYGNYGIFLIMGNAGFCPSAVALRAQHHVVGVSEVASVTWAKFHATTHQTYRKRSLYKAYPQSAGEIWFDDPLWRLDETILNNDDFHVHLLHILMS